MARPAELLPEWKGDPEDVDFPAIPTFLGWPHTCAFCRADRHDECDKRGSVFCECRRDLHEESF